MIENNRTDGSNDQNRSEQDQLRDLTMNETIREVSGNADANLNNLTDADAGNTTASTAAGDTIGTGTHGANYTPQDMSAVRSGGVADMDDQTASGAGEITGRRPGAGSDITQKLGTTGSDFDGQVSTS